jgi:pimeloyl-ACP methyl ester carboxylesterase
MLAYSEVGTGPALVLLHAFPMDRSLWRDVVAPIADAGWHVITPDLPGFGRSAETAASIDDMALAVALLLNELGVHSAVVGGCSMGGYVAMSFAAQFPERTAGLVLVDTKANADDEAGRANRERIAEQVLKSGSTAAIAATQPDAMFSRATHTDKPDVVAWLKATILEQTPIAVAAAQRAMATRAAHFETLAGLHVPLLCIRGAEDTVATAEDHTRMAKASGDALDVTIADAGHLVPIEQPEAFVAHVIDFLAKVRAPRC